MNPEPTSDAAALSQETVGNRLLPPDKNIPSTPAKQHSVRTVALWGLDSKHQTHECRRLLKAKDLAPLALPPASCGSLGVSLSPLDSG